MNMMSRIGVGHNSVQIPHNGVNTDGVNRGRLVMDKDEAWRRFEKMLRLKERARLIKNGVIVPASMMQPTPLVKIDGKWEVKRG